MEYPLSTTFRLLRRRSLWLLAAFFVVLSYFSASNLLQKIDERAEARGVVQWTERSVLLNRLITELQMERGMSSGFVASEGSKFSELLPVQRGRTDAAIAGVLAGLGQTNAAGELGITGILPGEEELRRLRQAVDVLRFSRQSVFDRYTAFIDVIFSDLVVSLNVGQSASVYRQQLASVFLSQMKEMAGQERALVTMMFSARAFEPVQLSEYQRIRATERARTEKFIQLADSGSIAQFDEIARSAPGRRVEYIRRLIDAIGASSDSSHVNIPDAERWFQQASDRINLIGDLEARLYERLVLSARALERDANRDLAMNALTALVSFLLAGTLIVQMLRCRKDIERNLLLGASVFRNSVESIVVADADCRIMDVNDAFVAATGYAREEVVGQHTRLFKSGRHDAAFYAAMWSALATRGTWQGEVWNRRKSGEVYPALLSIVAVKNSKGVVEHYLGISSDLAKHKQVEALVEQLRTFDPLTGLSNRDAWLLSLERLVQESQQAGKRFAVLEVGVDRFKAINETLGFNIGDKVLMQVADRLKSVVKRFDMVARLGGDRFSLLLPDIPEPQVVAHICERISSKFAEAIQAGPHSMHVTVSIGAAIFPDDGQDGDVLRRNAEFAMYVSKQTGRAGFSFYTREMNQQGERLFTIERMLHNALERQEFSLQYQPQVCATTGRLLGVEALLRWNSPDLGAISPVQFIPIAEETGLILPIGAWVLQEACQQAARWRKELGLELPVAVNLSAKQFRQKDLTEMVVGCLQAADLPASLLELEITESHLIQNPDESRRILDTIHQAGVRLALDDFGTGYSSLAYLKHFPIDRLKIDRAFVMGLPEDQDDQAISCSVIGLGNSLGMEVLAEGVETLAQATFLAENGCQVFQGYLYARPLSVAQLEAMIREGQFGLPA